MSFRCAHSLQSAACVVQEGYAEHSRAHFKVIPLPAIPADSLPQGLPFQLPQQNPFMSDASAAAQDVDPFARQCVLQPPTLLAATPKLRLWHAQAALVPPQIHVRSARL
jgi:hypothetical protein